jgi:zinc transport system ATP-binding protein
MSCIDVKNLSFSYGNEVIIKSVNFEIAKGDYVGLIGQNGSGKSTLLRLILGLLKPQSGSIRLFDTPVESFREWHRIGYIPQRSGIFDQTFPATVEEIVAMGLVNARNAADRHAIQRALEVVGMERYSARQLRELSGGQQQRVLIARAIVGEPDLILLDEPVVGVDTQAQQNFYQLLQHLNKKMNITLLLISHDLDIVAHEADYLIMLNQGEVCRCTREMFVKDKKKYIAI